MAHRVGDQSHETAAASLRTSGAELKAVLEKTGRRIKALSGIDKLDLLNYITEQIKEQIEHRGKMHLRFSELNELLMREGLAPQTTAKEAIQQLLQLRCRQLERLGSYSRTGLEEKDKTFCQALMDIPHAEINNCFAADDALSTAYAATDGAVSDTAWCENSSRESLRSSGQELKLVLEKTGRRLACLSGIDKLDLLNYIAEQIKEKVETRGRTNLKFSELNELLIREGLTPQPTPKDAIQQLLALRQRQLKRLGNYSRACVEEQDKTFCQALVAIPDDEVRNCFVADNTFRAEAWQESVVGPDARLVPPVRLKTASEDEIPSTTTPDETPCEIPLKSSGNALRAILEKTGHSLQGFGCMDKLDLLNSIAEQVRDKVELGQRMNLPLSDLQDFLTDEGLKPGETAKIAIQQLMMLRQRELTRLGEYVTCRSSTRKDVRDRSGDNSASKMMHIMEMPDDIVQACFAPEPKVVATDFGKNSGDVHNHSQVQVGSVLAYGSNLEKASPSAPKSVDPRRTCHQTDSSRNCKAIGTPEPPNIAQSLEHAGSKYAEEKRHGACSVEQAVARAEQAESKCKALETNVSELLSYIHKVEARASLAEERAKVAELHAALQKAETRAAAAEIRASKLEANLIALGGDPNLDAEDDISTPPTDVPATRSRTNSSKLSPRSQLRKSSPAAIDCNSPVSAGAKSLERSAAVRSQPALVKTMAKAKASCKTQEVGRPSYMEGRPIFR